MMVNHEHGTAIFDENMITFLVKTPRGEFRNVESVGGFDNYRQMDEYVGSDSVHEERKKNGLMAYLFESDEKQYLFYYPDGGDIIVYRVN